MCLNMKLFEFDENWHENQVPVLKEKFLPLWKGKRNVRALEIGSFEGRSTAWWMDNMDIVEMVCIDTWEGGEEHSRVDMNKIFENFKANVGNKVRWYQGYSHNILMDLIKDKRKFDFIYIDGSHMAKDVLLDAMLSDKLLVPGGIMLFDDYLWPAKLPEHHKPKLGIDTFYRFFYENYLQIYGDYQVCIKKKDQ